MKTVVVILLFVVQLLAFTLGIPMCIFICIGIPSAIDLYLPCTALFVIGTLAFIANQVLFYVWDKDK